MILWALSTIFYVFTYKRWTWMLMEGHVTSYLHKMCAKSVYMCIVLYDRLSEYNNFEFNAIRIHAYIQCQMMNLFDTKLMNKHVSWSQWIRKMEQEKFSSRQTGIKPWCGWNLWIKLNPEKKTRDKEQQDINAMLYMYMDYGYM